jgi:hypothetical protein
MLDRGVPVRGAELLGQRAKELNTLDIALIDADLVANPNQRFPNLALMKLSAQHKEAGHTVTLKLDYSGLDTFDLVQIAKVFTANVVPDDVLNRLNVEYGGTGFFYDKAEPLLEATEHHAPDYTLYADYVARHPKGSSSGFSEFRDYSIGFTTRGCFRKCSFCVNKRYDRSFVASPLSEFVDPDRPKICLLDDNVLSNPSRWDIFEGLKATGKPFTFKQGLDIRMLTEKVVQALQPAKYDGDYIFAFDNIADREMIESKLEMWREGMPSKSTKLYVFCGFDRTEEYSDEFWFQDIVDTFERIKILMQYRCLPYIMRHENYEMSPYRGLYINLARWCNQPQFFKKMTFRVFCEKSGGVAAQRILDFEREYPTIAATYFDLSFATEGEK